MNFARATKGPLTRSGATREIDCQSEIELGRHLNPAEKTSLFLKFSPQLVLNRIQQVIIINSINPSLNSCLLVWLWFSQVFVTSL